MTEHRLQYVLSYMDSLSQSYSAMRSYRLAWWRKASEALKLVSGFKD